MESSRFSTRSATRAGAQPPNAQPISRDDAVYPDLSYADVVDILNAAETDLRDRYDDCPRLLVELLTQYADGIEECKTGQRDPMTLLQARLQGEWLVCNAWNQHRLNQAEELVDTWKDIDEDLESFPLRAEVVISRGFDALAREFPLIYQRWMINALTTPQRSSKWKGKAPMDGDYESTTTKKKHNTGRLVDNYDKLIDACPTNLGWPDANMLLTEVACFLPNSFKAWDWIDRACGNGLGQSIASKMINSFRTMARGQITANSVYRMFKGPMSKRAKVEPHHDPSWEGWTTGIHHLYHDATNFDSTSVSVTGFRPAADGKDTSTHPPIPFANLAIGVKVFPSGSDALDLTRMIQHCVDHPDENWMYPTDYPVLLARIGGPARVLPAMYDSALIKRWTSSKGVVNNRKATGRNRDSRGRLRKKDSDDEMDFEGMDETDSEAESYEEPGFDELDKKSTRRKGKYAEDSDSDDYDSPSRKPKAKRAKIAPQSRRGQRGPSRLHKEVSAPDVDSESDSDSYQGPKSSKKKAKSPPTRCSGRITKVKVSYTVDHNDQDDENPDIEASHEKPDLIARYGMHKNMSSKTVDDEMDLDDAQED